MDGPRFDKWTRVFAAGATRRTVLWGLAGTAGGLLGFGRMLPGAAAVCRDAGRLCTDHNHCCSGLCDTTNTDSFRRNRCICPEGTENCGGVCVACLAPASCGGGPRRGCGCQPTTLTVPAVNPNFTPTGVILAVGGQVQITASGISDVCGGNDPNCVTGPDGSIVNCGPFTCGTFIGKIGPSGTPFAVGDSLLLTATSAGELFLNIFDQPVPGYYDDNTGSYTVTIACPS